MTENELVEALHTRMAARRQNKERRKTAALGVGCAGLTVFLLAIIFGQGMIMHEGRTVSLYSGAMMLVENAGGYVLVALASFMLGVCVTVYFKWQQRKNNAQQQEKVRPSQKNEGISLNDEALLMAAGGNKEQQETEEPENLKI